MTNNNVTGVVEEHRAEPRSGLLDKNKPRFLGDDPHPEKLSTPESVDRGELAPPPAMGDYVQEEAVVVVQPPIEAVDEKGPGDLKGVEPTTPLFESDAAAKLRSRWNEIQATFVDEPRAAVERADNLVSETTKKLAEGFAVERTRLEDQWGRAGSVSTEDLRLTLRRYRSFFNRLLSV